MKKKNKVENTEEAVDEEEQSKKIVTSELNTR